MIPDGLDHLAILTSTSVLSLPVKMAVNVLIVLMILLAFVKLDIRARDVNILLMIVLQTRARMVHHALIK